MFGWVILRASRFPLQNCDAKGKVLSQPGVDRRTSCCFPWSPTSWRSGETPRSVHDGAASRSFSRSCSVGWFQPEPGFCPRGAGWLRLLHRPSRCYSFAMVQYDVAAHSCVRAFTGMTAYDSEQAISLRLQAASVVRRSELIGWLGSKDRWTNKQALFILLASSQSYDKRYVRRDQLE